MVSRLKLFYNCARYMIQNNTPAPKEDSMHRAVSFSHLSTVVILGVWLCTQLTSPAVAQDRVRAKVGIQVRSGERTAPAKTTETVKTRPCSMRRTPQPRSRKGGWWRYQLRSSSTRLTGEATKNRSRCSAVRR